MADLLVGAEAGAVREGAVLYRALDDGRELMAVQMLPGQHRLILGEQDAPTHDDAWCYHDVGDVLVAVAHWDGVGDPPGLWYRHIGSGRRREFDAAGNVTKEEVRY